MKKIELLPAGAFVINKNVNEKIKGRFSMYVWDVFFKKNEVSGVNEMINLLIEKMTFSKIAELLTEALNDYNRDNPQYDPPMVMDLIDEVFEGGPADNELVSLLIHGADRVYREPDRETDAEEPTIKDESAV